MSNTPSKLPLGTTFVKLISGVFFLVGAVLDKNTNWQSQYYGIYYFHDYYDYSDSESYIAGSICLLVSIVMEAFLGPIKRNLYNTFFHIIGGMCIMLATLSPTLMQFEKWNEFVLEDGYFIPWCWIIGGLLLALCQIHLIYCFRSRGNLVIFTFLLAKLGSTLFMIVGILRTHAVASDLDPFVSDLDPFSTSTTVILFASVSYILHALMYPFACSKMNQQDQDDSGTSTPDVQFPIPLNNPDENKDVAAV